MTMCRFPACETETGGRDAVFCADHHFECTRVEAGFLLRISITARRTESPAEREHLRGQLNGYVAQVVRNIQSRQDKGASSVA